MTFIRVKENFVCGHCGMSVIGDGYTNHCPMCLWSQHVDTSPGDRAAICHGLMRPIQVDIERGENILTHRCKLCGYIKRNRIAEGDNRESMIAVMRGLQGFVQ
ncbi:MAG: RNHCP domain-containing protein [Candidatus Moraniibacteriota bacterium]